LGRFISATALSCLFVAASASAAVEFGRYRALVIGINDYRNISKLETAVNDATAMHAVLAQKYGFESELLLNPDRYSLVRKLDELRADLEPEDNLVIFYAGHGILDRGADQGYWLPVDAEEDSQANWISVSTITGTLRAMTAKHVLVIADSCYSGTLTRSAPVRLATGGDRIEVLKRLSSKRARKALTSGGLEPVVDGGGDGHSVFTGALLGVLRETDQPIDGYNLFTRLRRSVVVNAEQTPSYGEIRLSGDEGGDFVFMPTGAALAPTKVAAKGDGGLTRAPSRASKMDLELAFWNSIKDSKNKGDFVAYLKQFPEGAFTSLALARVEALRKEAAPEAPKQTALATPGVEMVPVDRMEGDYVAVTKTLVRKGPGSAHGVVATLGAGDSVSVSGKVQGRNWLQLSREGQVFGYAYAIGLRPKAQLDKRQSDQAARAAAASRARARAAEAKAEAARRAAAAEAKKAEEARRVKAEQNAAYQRYLDAQRHKDNQALQRERLRRSRPYGGTVIIQR
jgi:hypothetical protein